MNKTSYNKYSEKRNHVEIYYDILNFIYLSGDDARISNIIQKCNVSSMQGKVYLGNLIEKRIIKRTLGSKKYYILKDGKEVLSYLIAINTLVCEVEKKLK